MNQRKHDVLALAKTLPVAEINSYILSYPSILNFFASKTTFSADDFVCGAHMVYGWMPTILDLYLDECPKGLAGAAAILTKAKLSGQLSLEELDQLASVTNNSMVGASKLLHFAAPDSFAIWDSKIFTFLNGKAPHHYQVRDQKLYQDYLNLLADYRKDSRFPVFHATVNSAIGYPVSAMRAIEFVMFQNSPAAKVRHAT